MAFEFFVAFTGHFTNALNILDMNPARGGRKYALLCSCTATPVTLVRVAPSCERTTLS